MDTTNSPALPGISSTGSRELVTSIDLSHARLGDTSTHSAAAGTNIPSSEAMEPGPNVTLIAALVSAAVVMLVIGFGIFFLLRRRLRVEGAVPRKETTLRPWSGQSRTSEHSNHSDTPNSVDNFHADGEDIEMQPSFAFHPDVMTDEDFPDARSPRNTTSLSLEEPVARERQSNRQRKSASDRESVIFDTKNKSFSIKAKDSGANTKTMEDATTGKDETAITLEDEFIPGENASYSIVNKTLKREKENYDLAKVVTNTSNVIECPPDLDKANSDQDTAGGQYEEMVLDDEDESEMYINNATIRSSRIERNSEQRKETIIIKPSTKPAIEDIPHQAESKIDTSTEIGQRRLTKHPKPQPRLSKRKEFDPYDYPPGIPIRSSDIPVNGQCVDEPEGNQGDPGLTGADSIDNASSHDRPTQTGASGNHNSPIQTGASGYHDSPTHTGASGMGTDDVYDYPRSREALDDTDTIETERNTESIYDVPPSRASVS